MPMIVWVHGWSFVAQKTGFFWTKQMSNNFPLCNLAPKFSIFGLRLVFYHFLWQNVIGPKLCNFYLDCNQDQSCVISTNCDILDIMNIQCNLIIQFYTFSFFFFSFFFLFNLKNKQLLHNQLTQRGSKYPLLRVSQHGSLTQCNRIIFNH